MTSLTSTPHADVPGRRHGRSRAAREYHASTGTCSAETGTRPSDVALEDRGLRQPGQALANGPRPRLPDPLDRLQVVDVGRQQLLQVAEVVDQPLDDGA